MSKSKRIEKSLLADDLVVELDSKTTLDDVSAQHYSRTQVDSLLTYKLDKDGSLDWEQVTGKPRLADSSWRSPVATENDLPLDGNFLDDIRQVLSDSTQDGQSTVYTWDGTTWDLIGANDVNIDWSVIQGKPSTFTPSPHNHVESDISDLDKYTKSEVDSALSGKSDTTHNHVESDITDLDKYTTAEIDGKIEVVNQDISQKSDVTHTHVESDITDLDKYTKSEVDTALDGKSNVAHTHTELEISDLDKYTKSEVDSALSGKSNTSHTHSISDVTNLQSTLDGKVDEVIGKSLSSNDFTDTDKSKLDSLSDSATVDYQTMQQELESHTSDSTIHVTQMDKNNWNNKVSSSTFTGHTGNSTIHVTQTNKDNWDSKADGVHSHPELHTHSNRAILDAIEEAFTTTLLSKLNGVDSGANNYTHPSTHPATMITEDTTHRFVTDTEKSAWSGKADANHSHDISDVTNLQTSLNGKADLSHSHSISDVTNLQTSLNGKADASHAHIISDISNLQTELDNAGSDNVTDDSITLGGRFKLQYNSTSDTLDIVVI